MKLEKRVAPFPNMELYFEPKLNLTILTSVDNTDTGLRRHISISHPSRYPTWDEIKEIKYTLYPQLEMAILLPRQGDYVNVHENCFHIWEL